MIAARTLAELMLTVGVLALLLVSYLLWWTNVLADRAAGDAVASLQRQWADEPASGDALQNPRNGTTVPGQSFAILYIPKLDVKSPIAQGVGKEKVLDRGMVGHYDGVGGPVSAMPGDTTGNFALAAHRNSHGEPFRRINRLVPGDTVIVRTANTYYTYDVTGSLPQTSPANAAVVRPVPQGSGFTGPGRYLTLTTCTPEFTSTYRLIVWGKLASERPASQGPPPALAGGGS
ncbi:class E sortase [Streptomyces vinaceus]|uniref:class E sortase n=1 Tax=Streptomyces vinaceus TaxID=1960 RepID=UPI0035DF47F8